MGLVLSDHDLLTKLRNGETHVLKYCYTKSFSHIQKMILQKGGSRQDAEDIFQDTLIVFYKNCLNPGFNLTSSLSTYLYAISWRIWLKSIRNRGGESEALTDDHAIVESFDFELAEATSDSLTDVLKAMEQVGKNCKEILIAFYYQKLNFIQIAELINYKDERAVREQKYRCMKRIKDLLNP